MISNKRLLLLIATGLLVEANDIRATFEHGEYAGDTEQAKIAVQKVISTGAIDIVSIIDNGLTKIIGYISEANSLRSKTLEKTHSDIDLIVKEEESEAMVEPGSQTCKSKIIADIESMKAATVLKIDECLRKKVSVLDYFLTTIKSTANTAVTTVPSAAVASNKCLMSGGFATTCLGEVALDFWDQVKSLRGGVDSVLGKALEVHENLLKDLPLCAETRVELLRQAAVKVVEECKGKE